MWFSFIIFSIGLVGLSALFVFKAFDLKRAATTPLHVLRRNGDFLITDSWRRFKGELRARATHLFDTSSAFYKKRAHEAALHLHAAVHSLSVRFGEYLKRNGATGERNGHASTYVKDMLEYKKTQIHADNDADARG